MHFLKSCLKGRATDCIADIATTGENFDVAWKARKSRFENKRGLLNFHIASLFNLLAISKESAVDLQNLRDKVNLSESALKQLDRTPEELWNEALVHLVVQRLDPVTRKVWNVRTSDNDQLPSYDDVSKFVAFRARALEDFTTGLTGKSTSKSSSDHKVTAATASKTAQSVCPLCKARHFFNSCPQFVHASPSQRRELVRVHKRCFNCLSHGHAFKECKSKYTCRTCQQRHHSLLHVGSDYSSTEDSVSEL